VRAVQALPDGRLASASQDHTARLWTPKDGKSEGAGGVYYDIGDTLADHNHWVVSLAALPPGIVPECPQGGLVTGCLDKLVRVYDHQGKQQRMLQGHEGGVISFSWTAAGQRELGRHGEGLGRCGRGVHGHARRARERGVRARLAGRK
ncbi:unnamed protein product, partial [Ectocarpus fasciculatus]